MLALIGGFLIAALLYSMAGFGGGSTYNALLVLAETDYRVLPSIALVCNIIVVAGGVAQFRGANRMRIIDVAPLCLLSAPAAWLGGRIEVPESVFVPLLGLSLLAAGVFMFIDPPEPREVAGRRRLVIPVAIGGGIGFLSGIVGIGGGIFLAPLLHFLRWGRAHEIAGAASFFILVNSMTGLWGQAVKLGGAGFSEAFASYWPLPVAVAVGGLAGSFIGSRRLPTGAIKKLTGVLILSVAARLLWRVLA